MQNLATGSLKSSEIEVLANSLKNMGELNRKDIFNAINTALRATISEKNNQRTELINLYNVFSEENKHRYNSNVYIESNLSALKI